LVRLGVLLDIFAGTINILQRIVVVEMQHFLNAQQNIDGPMFAWFPFWKLIHKVDFASFRMDEWVINMRRIQKMYPWSVERIIDREI